MKKIFGDIKGRMFRLSEDEPLSPLSIMVMIFLDIFLLIVLFTGLDAQSQLLTNPDEYVPYTCQQIIIDKQWNEENRMDMAAVVVLDYYRSTYAEEVDNKKVHPLCRDLLTAIDKVRKNVVLGKLFEERDAQVLLRDEVKAELDKTHGIVKTDLEFVNKRASDEKKYKEISRKIASIESKINARPEIITLWKAIDTAISNQETVIRDLRHYRLAYPVYNTGIQFLFLLPLLLIFYLWYRKSTGSRLSSLISTHLMVVISIPIFVKIIELVLDIIPEQIIEKFIEMLNSIKLIALWYYLLIILGIIVALVLIYFLQKHLFSQERVWERRIRNHICIKCGKKMPEHDDFCSICGAEQKKICPECGKETYINSSFCRSCGRKQNSDQKNS